MVNGWHQQAFCLLELAVPQSPLPGVLVELQSRHMNIMDPVESHNPGHRWQCHVCCVNKPMPRVFWDFTWFCSNQVCASLSQSLTRTRTHAHAHPHTHSHTLTHTHTYTQTHTRHIPYSQKVVHYSKARKGTSGSMRHRMIFMLACKLSFYIKITCTSIHSRESFITMPYEKKEQSWKLIIYYYIRYLKTAVDSGLFLLLLFRTDSVIQLMTPNEQWYLPIFGLNE